MQPFNGHLGHGLPSGTIRVAEGLVVTQLLLATTNPGKLAELRSLLEERGVELTDLRREGVMVAIPEVGADYAENALAKAVGYARASGLWTLADDTGLEVEALGGEPGLRSARAAGDDAARRARLLSRLAAHPRPWPARFCCAVALASPDGEAATGHGICQGEIIPDERGENGFGYDPIFLVAGSGMTMAELPPHVKDQMGHRGGAVEDLLSRLRQGALPNSPLR
jgi:XTP/dITP diphosphohydrolase